MAFTNKDLPTANIHVKLLKTYRTKQQKKIKLQRRKTKKTTTTQTKQTNYQHNEYTIKQQRYQTKQQCKPTHKFTQITPTNNLQ